MSADNISITIICSLCLNNPLPDGCDATGCTWRAEALASAIRDGAPFRVVYDSLTTSDADKSEGRLNVRIEAYTSTEGNT